MNLIHLQQYTISEENLKNSSRDMAFFNDLIIIRIDGTEGYVRSGTASTRFTAVRWSGDQGGGISLKGYKFPPNRIFISIKLFKQDTSVREAAHQLSLSYKTIYDLFDHIRHSIVRTNCDT